MPTSVPTPLTYLGLDIAKLTLDLSPLTSPKGHAFTNDPAGHRRLIKLIRSATTPIHLILEASGGYERGLMEVLHQVQIPFTRVNPRQVRDFARGKGILAKTDRLDAQVLAAYGRNNQPAATPALPPARRRLKALVARRQELLVILGQEQHRAEQHQDPFVCRQAAVLLRTLKKQMVKLEAELATLELSEASLHHQVQRLAAVQGIGRRTAWLLLAALPELGTLARGQAAALAGLAPYNYDSGPFRGQRHILHGRLPARQALYMAALVAARWNPVLRPVYQRLRAAGKPAKVALTALMRRLAELANHLLKHPDFKLT